MSPAFAQNDSLRTPTRLLTFLAVFVFGFFIGWMAPDVFRQQGGEPRRFIAQAADHEIYFSPDGRIQKRLVDLIGSSQTSIDIAIYNLTAEPLAAALRRAQGRGVMVRVVADEEQSKNERSLIPALIRSGVHVKIRRGEKGGIMHNKFAVFDGRLLFTGSYNWTNNAEFKNFENAVFTTDADIVFAYAKEFEILWVSPR